MYLTQPDDLTYAVETRQLRFEADATRLALSRRIGKSGPMQHPDLREPDWDDADMLAAGEDVEPRESGRAASGQGIQRAIQP